MAATVAAPLARWEPTLREEAEADDRHWLDRDWDTEPTDPAED